MEYEYFDVHSHLYFPDFDIDREEEIAKLKESKIATITIGTDAESSQKAVDLAEKHDNLFASVGQHPGDVTLESVFDKRLEILAENKKVVAIGECGLDYFRLPPESASTEVVARQRKIFQNHIDLSLKLNKPLMLHIRPQKARLPAPERSDGGQGTQDAYYDALEILEGQNKISGEKLRGNVHFFVGDLDVMKRFLNIGFTMSFTGVITFAKDYDETLKYAPLNMIMSETDSPFVAPMPYRGQRNSPLYVPEVVKKIAEIRGEPFEDVKIALRNNALRVFNITL